MKCIVSKSGKTIDRVKDDVARQKVSTGAWSYTSKESWKKATRKVAVVDAGIIDETDSSSEKIHGLKSKERKISHKDTN
jgi:hypothetical protein